MTLLASGRFRWLSHDWTVADAVGFAGLCDDLLAACEPSATLLRLQLAGIVPLTDRVAMLARIEDHLAHRLRHLDVRDANVVAKPTEWDLARKTAAARRPAALPPRKAASRSPTASSTSKHKWKATAAKAWPNTPPSPASRRKPKPCAFSADLGLAAIRRTGVE
ncbi:MULTISPECIES: hypothetical protein [unclassified Novosphingobium]|uniref:hypothetical protein n=1 Tax=unclassified Novosphingobium TaxID=2644732 RepID=UPI00190F6ADC|nr:MULTISPECIES: hypothetical protein [unclassified Novosphingobium]